MRKKVTASAADQMAIRAVAKRVDSDLRAPPLPGDVVEVDKSQYAPQKMDPAVAKRGWIMMRIRRIPTQHRGWLQTILVGYGFRPMELPDAMADKAIAAIEKIEAGTAAMKPKKHNKWGGQK